MSRLKNFSRNLATSYLQLGVNVIYSLVSVPMILHWLPKAEFGMWVVLVQLMSYITLVDMGMTTAVARLLVDHKDQRSDGGYGSLVKTAFLVSLVQGLIIFTVAALGSPLLANLMKIPVEYRATFIALLRWQGLFTAGTFFMRPLGLMLYAHQRMDIQAYSDMLTLVANLGFLLLFLMKECGIYSFIYANAVALLIGPVFLFLNCRRLNFLPQTGEWGHTSWKIFQSVFNYGKDVFLMGLGSQLITASQTIIISRCLGLELAAIWSVGIKMFNLVGPLTCRPYGAAMPGLFELLARGENERLRRRFKEMVVLTASLGVFLGVAFALCNSLFVQAWTGGKITWSPLNDVLLAFWLFISSLQTTHCNFVTVTKKIGGMRYIYFIEGCSFVLSAVFWGSRWGLSGIITCSILCTILFSYQYGLRMSCVFFHCKFEEVAFVWIRPSLKLAFILVPLAIGTWCATAALPPFWRLACNASVAGMVGGFLFLRFGIPFGITKEISQRLPQPANKLWQLMIPAKLNLLIWNNRND